MRILLKWVLIYEVPLLSPDFALTLARFLIHVTEILQTGPAICRVDMVYDTGSVKHAKWWGNKTDDQKTDVKRAIKWV